VITLSEVVDNRPIWETALEGGNMLESAYWNEQNAIAVARTELRSARQFLLELLVERMGHSFSHENLINQMTDLARPARMRKVQLTATSWDAVTAVE